MVFNLSALWWRRIRGLWKLPDGRDWLRGKLGLVLMGRARLSKSWLQFFVDGRGYGPSLLFTWGQTMVQVMATSFERSHACTATLNAPHPAAGHCRPTPLPETPGHSRASLGQSLVKSLLLSPGSWCTQGFVCALQESQKDRTLKDELPRSVGAQHATKDQWRNNWRKNEEMEPKQNQHTVVDVTGDGSKVQCCKKQYCIGTWNVRSKNQDKLEVVRR